MTGTILLLIGLIAAGGYGAYITKSRDKARDALVVWGALGPFEDASESARALAAASKAVLGEPGEKLRQSFQEHKIAFDDAPDEWADSQKRAAAAVERKHERYIAKARVLLDEDAFNALFQDLVYEADFTTTPDGQVNMGVVQTKSDDQIQKEREERDTQIVTALGKALKAKKKKPGQELYAYVKSLAEFRDDFLTDEDVAVGSVYLQLLTPNLDDETLSEGDANIVRTFRTLSIEDDLENDTQEDWSAYPGNRELCFKKVMETKLIAKNKDITAADVREAHESDAQEYWKLKERFLTFQKQFSDFDFEIASKKDILDLREWLSDLMWEMYGLGAPAEVMLSMAEKAYMAVVSLLEENAKFNEAELAAINEAIAKDQEHRRKFATELSNLVQHCPPKFTTYDFAVLLLKSKLDEFEIFVEDENYRSPVERVLPIMKSILSDASGKETLSHEIPDMERKVGLLQKIK